MVRFFISVHFQTILTFITLRKNDVENIVGEEKNAGWLVVLGFNATLTARVISW